MYEIFLSPSIVLHISFVEGKSDFVLCEQQSHTSDFAFTQSDHSLSEGKNSLTCYLQMYYNYSFG